MNAILYLVRIFYLSYCVRDLVKHVGRIAMKLYMNNLAVRALPFLIGIRLLFIPQTLKFTFMTLDYIPETNGWRVFTKHASTLILELKVVLIHFGSIFYFEVNSD